MRCLSLCCLLLLSPLVYAQVSVVDDFGNRVELASPARRIVSLAPHITEMLFAAGAGEHIIGTVEYSDYPAQASAVPRVGNYKLMDLESIVAMRPDLVVAWQSGNPREQVNRLRELGLTIYLAEPKNIADIPAMIEQLGMLADTRDVSQQAAREFRHSYARLQETYSGKERVRVFYQVWDRPLITINGDHMISAVIELCGGINIFSGMSSLAPRISEESVLAQDPAVIIASGMNDQRPEWLDRWRKWQHLVAVKNRHLYFIPPDLIQRHTPRILQGAQLMCEQLERVRASGSDNSPPLVTPVGQE